MRDEDRWLLQEKELSSGATGRVEYGDLEHAPLLEDVLRPLSALRALDALLEALKPDMSRAEWLKASGLDLSRQQSRDRIDKLRDRGAVVRSGSRQAPRYSPIEARFEGSP